MNRPNEIILYQPDETMKLEVRLEMRLFGSHNSK